MYLTFIETFLSFIMYSCILHLRDMRTVYRNFYGEAVCAFIEDGPTFPFVAAAYYIAGVRQRLYNSPFDTCINSDSCCCIR